jgi:hypothetical protein
MEPGSPRSGPDRLDGEPRRIYSVNDISDHQVYIIDCCANCEMLGLQMRNNLVSSLVVKPSLRLLCGNYGSPTGHGLSMPSRQKIR